MRRFFAVAVLTFTFAGCGSLNKAFVKQEQDFWSAVGPEYRAYVDADPKLTTSDKAARFFNCDTHEKLLQEAAKSVEEE